MTGYEMRMARERKGISRQTLGELIGGCHSNKQIKHWEDTHPPRELQPRIREALDMQEETPRSHKAVRTSSGMRFGWKVVSKNGTQAKKPAGFDQKRSCGDSGDGSCDQIRNEEGRVVITENVKNWARNQKRVTNNTICKQFKVNVDEADEIYQTLKRIGIVGRMGYTDKGLGLKEDN